MGSWPHLTRAEGVVQWRDAQDGSQVLLSGKVVAFCHSLSSLGLNLPFTRQRIWRPFRLLAFFTSRHPGDHGHSSS